MASALARSGRRLYKEAREYLTLRSKRKQFVKEQKQQSEESAVLTTGD
jgi:tRNA U55 pseudouridine synthase TruB